MNKLRVIILSLLFCISGQLNAQTGKQKFQPLKINLSEDGKQYIRFSFMNQVWVRFTDANPGTLVNAYPQSHIFDIGLRRTRIQMFGKISPRVYFYTQLGMNNFGSNSRQYQGFFFHDAVCEFMVHEKALSLGTGLSGWSGLSRYASASVSTIMSLDLPLYQEATNGINDQFLRKLGVYAKGKLGRLDYRLALTKPMAVQNAVTPVANLSAISDFSMMPGKAQLQGYCNYQFFDQEDNTNPYNIGTYLGKKKLLNIGTGIIYQPDAMWHLDGGGDTVTTQMLLLGVDLFYEAPLNQEKGNALTAYLAYNKYDFGNNYLRNAGAMNPGNGVNADGTFNGAGNAFPMVGTGHILYGQLGYLFKKNLIGNGTIQLYGAAQYASFDRLDDNMLMCEGGFNWLIEGSHESKISLNYQSRPLFDTTPTGALKLDDRKGVLLLQYQVSI